jgi:5-methylcytosine-specific restriction protein A
MAEHQELFTQAEAAAFLRYQPSTLAVWRSYAEGPAYIKLGRTVRYCRRDLDEWLYGGPAVRQRIQETADCHVEKRKQKLSRRPRGRALVELREEQLSLEPHCRDCRQQGRERLADEVDHITPLADGGTNSQDNLRSLCRPCHALRTRGRWQGKR